VHLIELRVVDTEYARDRLTKRPLGFRTDWEQYDPTQHEPIPFRWRENLRGIINAPLDPRAGVTPDDLGKSIRLLKRLKKASDGAIIDLEDSDWEYLRTKVLQFNWPSAEEWFFDLREFFANASPNGKVAE
jgi:hypothetical protein